MEGLPELRRSSIKPPRPARRGASRSESGKNATQTKPDGEMDPLSITTGCLTLIGSVAETAVAITTFIRGCREARADLTAVNVELSELQIVLELLKDDSAINPDDDASAASAAPIPDALQRQILSIITNCTAVIDKINHVLEGYNESSSRAVVSVRWAATGKAEIAGLRMSLEAHRGSLNLALELISVTVARAIKEDTAVIRGHVVGIKEDTGQIPQILEELERLRAIVASRGLSGEGPQQNYMLQQYLDNLTSYAETVVGDVDWGSDGCFRAGSRQQSVGAPAAFEDEPRDDWPLPLPPEASVAPQREAVIDPVETEPVAAPTSLPPIPLRLTKPAATEVTSAGVHVWGTGWPLPPAQDGPLDSSRHDIGGSSVLAQTIPQRPRSAALETQSGQSNSFEDRLTRDRRFSFELGEDGTGLQIFAPAISVLPAPPTELAPLVPAWESLQTQPPPDVGADLGVQELKAEASKSEPALSAAVSTSTAVARRKLVAIGDGACGKTCLLEVYALGAYPEIDMYATWEAYTADVDLGGKHVELCLQDTCGIEDYDRLSRLFYPDTDVFLICFAIDSPDSLDNVEEKWISEVLHFGGSAPYLLVGLKKDLRFDSRTIENLRNISQHPVTLEEAQRVCAKIGASGYVECSARTNEGLREVFDKATRLAVAHPRREKKGWLRGLFSGGRRSKSKGALTEKTAGRSSLI